MEISVLLVLAVALLAYLLWFLLPRNPNAVRIGGFAVAIILFAFGASLGATHWTDYQTTGRSCL